MLLKTNVALTLFIASSTPALAYIGPGAGIGVIGTALAMLGAVVLLLVGFVWYPLKRFLKRHKTDDAADTEKRP